MAVPAFLNTSFHFRSLMGVVDVADVITAFRDEALNQLSTPWTEPVGGTFVSPPLADGRFMSVVLSRVSATRMQAIFKDMFGNTMANRTMDLEALGNAVYVYSGQCHVAFDSVRPSPEAIGAFLIDTTPETIAIPAYTMCAFGARDSAGTLGGYLYWHHYYMLDATTYATGVIRANYDFLNGTYQTARGKSCSGAYIFAPVLIGTNLYGSSNGRWIGRLFQALCTDDSFANGAEVTVPIDTGSTGVFKIIRTSSGGQKMCIRIA